MIEDLVTLKYLCTGGDEISHYETVDFQKLPASDYIKTIVENKKEWGDIYLFDYDTSQKDKIEYREGVIEIKPIHDWSDKIVSEVSYAGGWSYGGWHITTGVRKEN